MTFFASALFTAASIVAAAVPPIGLGAGAGHDPQVPAPQGYVLPWPGGEIEEVTQGEETGLTHNGLSAYAFDFGMNYDTVVAARGGRVAMVREDSNLGGCDLSYAGSANYLVIDHGDGTSSLYLHLAYAGVLVERGATVARGEPIAISGDTGVTCSDDDTATAPHLHFQVQRSEDSQYLTQSLPITFDDVDGTGVPQEGGAYVSGNFGNGRPQKVQLHVRRAERVFNPQARPEDPRLAEAIPLPATPTVSAEVTLAPTATADPGASATELPAVTPTPQPADSRTPTRTPVAVATPTPSPSLPTPEPSPSLPSEDTPTAGPPPNTPVPEPPPPDTTPVP